jgi:hypothetical protein
MLFSGENILYGRESKKGYGNYKEVKAKEFFYLLGP